MSFNVPRWANAELLVLPVKANAVIRQGAIVVLDGGYAKEGVAGANLIAAGVAQETVDNTGGADGAKRITVRRGVFRFENDPADPVGTTELLKEVYISGPNTVAKTSPATAPRSPLGRLVAIDQYGVWVEIK